MVTEFIEFGGGVNIGIEHQELDSDDNNLKNVNSEKAANLETDVSSDIAAKREWVRKTRLKFSVSPKFPITAGIIDANGDLNQEYVCLAEQVFFCKLFLKNEYLSQIYSYLRSH